MDKKEVIKLLAGTITRGLMWGFSALATYIGIESIKEETASQLAYFLAAGIVAGIATAWSKKKDKKLAESEPKHK